MDLNNDDIMDVLEDLHKQATTERSHYYVGTVLTLAMQEISRLRAEARVSSASSNGLARDGGSGEADVKNLGVVYIVFLGGDDGENIIESIWSTEEKAIRRRRDLWKDEDPVEFWCEYSRHVVG